MAVLILVRLVFPLWRLVGLLLRLLSNLCLLQLDGAQVSPTGQFIVPELVPFENEEASLPAAKVLTRAW